jgi:hypothetical protein
MKKSKITHAMLVAEGIVDESPVDPRNKPVTTAPVPVAVDIVARPTPINPAPKITDPKRKMPPQATGLQRSINAAILASGGTLPEPVKRDDNVTGLQRSINAAIAKKS